MRNIIQNSPDVHQIGTQYRDRRSFLPTAGWHPCYCRMPLQIKKAASSVKKPRIAIQPCHRALKYANK
jgi:hypothetical protein